MQAAAEQCAKRETKERGGGNRANEEGGSGIVVSKSLLKMQGKRCGALRGLGCRLQVQRSGH